MTDNPSQRPKDSSAIPPKIDYPAISGSPPGISLGPNDFTPINPNRTAFNTDDGRLGGPAAYRDQTDATRLKPTADPKRSSEQK